MRAILIALGSSGDVHPFIGIGLELRARGHQILLVSNPHFEPLARRVGLDFAPVSTIEEYNATMANPDLWSPTKGFTFVVEKLILPGIRPLYELIEREATPDTVVVAPATALGARVAQEKLGVPLATVHLQPLILRSLHDGAQFALFGLGGWGPRWFKRLLYKFIDRVCDRAIGPDLNALRAELDLPPVKQIMHLWWQSPQRVIGLFPDWFAPPQPDWPPNTILTGFPLWDETGATETPAALLEFLDAGTPPIVFTPGSAMLHAHEFFIAGVDACQRLGRRGVFLTRYPEQLPSSLPESVRHFDFAPLSQILPRSAALVYHGGIGTLSQGLAAGIPHLVMPMSHDQPDNAARLKRLGVGLALRPKKFRGPKVAAALSQLLNSPEVARRCRELAGRFNQQRSMAETCAAIEALATK